MVNDVIANRDANHFLYPSLCRIRKFIAQPKRKNGLVCFRDITASFTAVLLL